MDDDKTTDILKSAILMEKRPFMIKWPSRHPLML